MPKRDSGPVTQADLERFLETESDFAFEMRVLYVLRSLGFACEHSGTYQDPITNKIRQFDIRAQATRGPNILGLAVECKNIRADSPLLVTAVPRAFSETAHQVFVNGSDWISTQMRQSTRFYEAGNYVGKKVEQIKCDREGRMIASDQETFDKTSQAINSLRDIAQRFAARQANFRTAVPVLVVPEGRLWQVDFSDGGEITTHPRQVETATLFVNHKWRLFETLAEIEFIISHLEIVTFPAISQRVDNWLGPEGLFRL